MIPIHRNSSVAIPSLQIVRKHFIHVPLMFEYSQKDSEPESRVLPFKLTLSILSLA